MLGTPAARPPSSISPACRPRRWGAWSGPRSASATLRPSWWPWSTRPPAGCRSSSRRCSPPSWRRARSSATRAGGRSPGLCGLPSHGRSRPTSRPGWGRCRCRRATSSTPPPSSATASTGLWWPPSPAWRRVRWEPPSGRPPSSNCWSRTGTGPGSGSVTPSPERPCSPRCWRRSGRRGPSGPSPFSHRTARRIPPASSWRPAWRRRPGTPRWRSASSWPPPPPPSAKGRCRRRRRRPSGW